VERRYHPDCRVEIAGWGDREAFRCEDAEVWIEGEAILISYFDDEGIVVLEGREDGAGGWQLVARSRPRRARLRPEAREATAFVGEIEEHGETAGFRLRLSEPAGQAVRKGEE
jgi:hypothetical protein